MYRGELKTLEEVQELWGTTQNTVVVPTLELVHVKNVPISLLVAASMCSGSIHSVYEKDTLNMGRYISPTNLNKALITFGDVRATTPKQIKTKFNKLLKYNSREFIYVASKEEKHTRYTYDMYYQRGGYTTINLNVAHYLLEHYSDAHIQAYIILKCLTCRGFAQVTHKYLAIQMGLTEHSRRKVSTILEDLVTDGLVEKVQNVGYKYLEQNDGAIRTVVTEINKYRVVEGKYLK